MSKRIFLSLFVLSLACFGQALGFLLEANIQGAGISATVGLAIFGILHQIDALWTRQGK